MSLLWTIAWGVVLAFLILFIIFLIIALLCWIFFGRIIIRNIKYYTTYIPKPRITP